ncbi:MAG: cation-transporting P-type ATPase [Planctomycetaceae bacterium]|nr:cation-transporting P-type ATPase [Planctomycetaceae bacterium]
MQTILRQHCHRLPAGEVLDLLGVDVNNGLDPSEIEIRQERFGRNVLTQQKATSPFVLFLLQFHQPLVYILLATVVITAFLHEWVDSSVILGVVLVNAAIGFVQESKALKAIEALSRAMTSDATVLRAGDKQRVPAVELIPGDVVFLQSGDKIPADLRILRSRDLQVDESALTGESVPVEKQAESLDPDTVLADRSNMAYSSTLVTYGTGIGVVTATGDHTEIGRINALIASTDVLATPLTRRIEQFSRVLLIVILALAGLTFLIGRLRGEPWLDMLMAAVSLAVGAIPEGLPAAMTITLAIGVGKMANRNAIIRKLPAVETLGSTTIICSDKTGTLTQNEMTVQQIWAGGQMFHVSGIGYAPEGTFQTTDGAMADPSSNAAIWESLRAGLLCNDSRLVHRNNSWHIEGDPTEGALLTVARKAGLELREVIREFPRVDAIPFESQHQYMVTLHTQRPGNPAVLYLKGAVEGVLARCSHVLTRSGELQPLDREEIYRQVDALAGQGLRVLAFCRGETSPEKNSVGHADVAEGLTFLGLQGMIDPPRSEAIAAVRACQRAGIQVKMITGDHAGTAGAIAREIGLDGLGESIDKPLVLTGKQLASMSDGELQEAATRSAVFARVAPEQKLRLVEALQATGNVVAMTGDGVNDAPALRRADIGVAMGITGTDVAKEAADMVLTDDNFSSIEAAVEEGRGVYDNLVKFITWTLPTNLGEGLVILAAIFAGQTLPITPVQILWINMTTAVLLGLMLAFEPKEPGIMTRPPRAMETPILTRPLILRIILVGILLLIGSFGIFEWEIMQGESEAKARTAAVNVFVFGELFYLFNCRSLQFSMLRLGLFSNPWVLLGAALQAGLQILFTYAPFMNRAFGSEPIGPTEWALVFATGLVIYIMIGIEKGLRRWFSTPRQTGVPEDNPQEVVARNIH